MMASGELTPGAIILPPAAGENDHAGEVLSEGAKRMKGLLLAVLLSTVFAQILPGCDGQARVIIGMVEAKYETDGQTFLIVDKIDYRVPAAFWSQVDVGDWVRWDGFTWTIHRKRGS